MMGKYFIPQRDTAVPIRQAQSINVNHANDQGVHQGPVFVRLHALPSSLPTKLCMAKVFTVVVTP